MSTVPKTLAEVRAETARLRTEIQAARERLAQLKADADERERPRRVLANVRALIASGEYQPF